MDTIEKFNMVLNAMGLKDRLVEGCTDNLFYFIGETSKRFYDQSLFIENPEKMTVVGWLDQFINKIKENDIPL